jgi:hypothetical protein
MITTTVSPFLITLNTIEDCEDRPITLLTLPKQAVEELLEKGEVEVEVDNEKQYTELPKLLPPDPPPEMYLSGRSIWIRSDGSTWRYSRGQKKWVQTS